MDKILCMIAVIQIDLPGVIFAAESPAECGAAEKRATELNKETEDDKSTVYVVVAGKPCKFTQTCREDEQ